MLNDIFNKIRDTLNETFCDKDVVVKCPNCGGQTPGKQSQKMLTCQYCDATIENTEYKDLFSVLKDNNAAAEEAVNDIDEVSFNDDFDAFPDYGDQLFAYIEKSTIFYNGEIPGISFGKANLCSSYNECAQKLREIANNERSKAFYKKPTQDPRQIRKAHPNAKIIRL